MSYGLNLWLMWTVYEVLDISGLFLDMLPSIVFLTPILGRAVRALLDWG